MILNPIPTTESDKNYKEVFKIILTFYNTQNVSTKNFI